MVAQNNQVAFDWTALFGWMCAFMLMVALVRFSERLLESLESPKLLPQTRRKNWIDEIAKKEPFTIYPWLYEKFGGRKLADAPWEERYKVAQRICAQLDLVYNIPCKAQKHGTVEIPSDYFTSNKHYVMDALDEITGVKHKRPWHSQSLLPQTELTEEQTIKLREALGLSVDTEEVLRIHRETGYVPC